MDTVHPFLNQYQYISVESIKSITCACLTIQIWQPQQRQKKQSVDTKTTASTPERILKRNRSTNHRCTLNLVFHRSPWFPNPNLFHIPSRFFPCNLLKPNINKGFFSSIFLAFILLYNVSKVYALQTLEVFILVCEGIITQRNSR